MTDDLTRRGLRGGAAARKDCPPWRRTSRASVSTSAMARRCMSWIRLPSGPTQPLSRSRWVRKVVRRILLTDALVVAVRRCHGPRDPLQPHPGSTGRSSHRARPECLGSQRQALPRLDDRLVGVPHPRPQDVRQRLSPVSGGRLCHVCVVRLGGDHRAVAQVGPFARVPRHFLRGRHVSALPGTPCLAHLDAPQAPEGQLPVEGAGHRRCPERQGDDPPLLRGLLVRLPRGRCVGA